MRDLLYDRIYWFLSDRPKRAIEADEHFTLGSITGSVRKQNEDVAVIANVRNGRAPHRDFVLAVVCDGMGGMADGRRAALKAASAFVSSMLRFEQYSSPVERLGAALASAQHEVFDELRGDGGTTLSALFLDQSEQGWLIHVGDSRIYAIAADRTLRQLSRDDTIGAVLNREGDKRADSNRLIQFIGLEGDLEPQVLAVNLRDYVGFLLTSDGAHSAPPEILSMVARHVRSSGELVRKLLNLADALGGLDNATAVHIPATINNRLPSDGDRGGRQDDALATIICASGTHDIWIAQADPRFAVRSQPAVGPVGDEHDRRGGHNDPAPVAKFKIIKKRRQNQPKLRAEPPHELPLNVEKPVAKLDFSDDQESKS